MKILILGGFLGSGKTTILLQLASYLVKSSTLKKKCAVAIIENEIGQLGIDDKMIEGQGYAVKDILSGCVCCSLSSNLLAGINEIEKNIDPEWIIIEATGVAFPEKIAEVIRVNLKMQSRIITIVDAKRWKRIRVPMENLIEGQLCGADCILINKIDLVNGDELEHVFQEIQTLNSEAIIFPISGMQQLGEELLEVLKNG